MLLAAAALGGVAYGARGGARRRCSASALVAQIVAVGAALAAGGAVYAAAVLALRIPEATQIVELIRGRLRPRAS